VVGEPVPNLAMSGGQVPGISVAGTPIKGILEDVSYEHPLADIDPTLFTTSGIALRGVAVIESTRTAAALQKEFQEVGRALNLNMNGNVVSLAKARSDLLAPDRARGFLTIATAVLVVLLAAFGFYGTQRYLVTAGRREYAIRASLGAGPRALGRLVMKRGLMLGLPGLVLGVPLAFILVAWLRDDYISRSVSPLAVSVAIALGLVALLLVASLGPARLARRTQPAPLLRQD
jgi:ABC-type antimicrobial peptide transport system permease subunit